MQGGEPGCTERAWVRGECLCRASVSFVVLVGDGRSMTTAPGEYLKSLVLPRVSPAPMHSPPSCRTRAGTAVGQLRAVLQDAVRLHRWGLARWVVRAPAFVPFLPLRHSMQTGASDHLLAAAGCVANDCGPPVPKSYRPLTVTKLLHHVMATAPNAHGFPPSPVPCVQA